MIQFEKRFIVTSLGDFDFLLLVKVVVFAQNLNGVEYERVFVRRLCDPDEQLPCLGWKVPNKRVYEGNKRIEMQLLNLLGRLFETAVSCRVAFQSIDQCSLILIVWPDSFPGEQSIPFRGPHEMAPDRTNDNARDGGFDNLARMINCKHGRAGLLFREELKHEVGKASFQ